MMDRLLTCMIASAVWAAGAFSADASHCPIIRMVYDLDRKNYAFEGPLLDEPIWGDQPEGSQADKPPSKPERNIREITPEESARHYYAKTYRPMSRNLADGEMVFIGKFSLRNPEDKDRLQDWEELSRVIRQHGKDTYESTGEYPLIGNVGLTFFNALKFDGTFEHWSGQTEISTNKVTYKIEYLPSDYHAPRVGLPPLDQLVFGVFEMISVHENNEQGKEQSFLIKDGTWVHQMCPRLVQRFWKEPAEQQRWEAAFRTCFERDSHPQCYKGLKIVK